MNYNNGSLRVMSLVIALACVLAAEAESATPKLQSVAVTPASSSISVGQTQAFTATGMFSDGTKQTLGRNISDLAAGWVSTCALTSTGGVDCWGNNTYGELGTGTTLSLIHI